MSTLDLRDLSFVAPLGGRAKATRLKRQRLENKMEHCLHHLWGVGEGGILWGLASFFWLYIPVEILHTVAPCMLIRVNSQCSCGDRSTVPPLDCPTAVSAVHG